MSVLGHVSAQLEREQQLLDAINHAVLTLQADALGVRDALRLDQAAVDESRCILRTFIEQLIATMAGGVADETLASLAELLAGHHPREDWIEDLNGTRSALAAGTRLNPAQLTPLTEVVRALDREFAGTLHQLYGRQ